MPKKKPSRASISYLARISLRTQMLFIVTLSVAIIMLSLCYWMVTTFVTLATHDARSHFQHLASNLHAQESFLYRATRNDAARLGQAVPAAKPVLFELIDLDQITNTYEGQSASVDMPYIVKVPHSSMSVAGDNSQSLLPVATALSNLYGSYRNTWHNPGNQAFLVDLNSAASISVPCSQDALTDDVHRWWRCRLSADRIRELIYNQVSQISPSNARWMQVNTFGAGPDTTGYVLFRPIELSSTLWLPNSPHPRLVLATFTGLSDAYLHDTEGDQAYFREIILSGKAGVNADSGVSALHSEDIETDADFTLDGVRIVAWYKDGWSASYLVSYGSFFYAAQSQLTYFAVLVLLCAACSLWLYRRHLNAVVKPAQESHNRIVESESFSRAVIEAARVAVCAVRISDWTVVAKNHLADKWLGDVKMVRQFARDPASFSRQDSHFTGDAASYLEIDGRHLSISWSRVKYKGDDVILVTVSDITDHKLAQAALADAKRAADDANAGKTVFLATMSHEIRTPLYGALGTLELLSLTSLNNQQRGYLSTIRSSSAGLLNVINDILDVSKIESRQMTLKDSPLHPRALTEEILQAYAATADAKGLEFYSTVATDVPNIVHGDIQRIRQILNNLVSNAIKFTKEGSVRVNLKRSRHDGAKDVIQWEVVDTGAGISADQQQHLFQPFYQASASHQPMPGTGLGLYICHSLCALMNGTITLRTTPGHGSTFILCLPLPSALQEKSSHPGDALDDVPPIWVRSLSADQGTDICAWLRVAGADATLIGSTETALVGSGILVELTPRNLPPRPWNGVRISCQSTGPNVPHWTDLEIHVTSHIRDSIIEAVRLAQQGPLTDRPVEAPAYPSSPTYGLGQDLRRLGLRVLVAEDNATNRLLLAQQLEELGCEVGLCSNGAEALEHWSNEEFDVLITDMNMPVMDGYELIRTLRSRSSNVPIVGLTADALITQRDKNFTGSLNAWILKPVDLRTLHDALSNACTEIIREKFAVQPNRLEVQNTKQHRYDEELRTTFITTMSADIAALQRALKAGVSEDLISTLHRIRGSLVVVGLSDLADFCGVLEHGIASKGLTPSLEYAVRSTLQQLEHQVQQIMDR